MVPVPPISLRLFQANQPPINHGKQFSMSLGNATKAFKLDAKIEGNDEGNHSLDRKLLSIDAIVGHGLGEGLVQYLVPLLADPRHALLQLRVIPRERLKFQPDLLIATGEVLIDEQSHCRPPFL